MARIIDKKSIRSKFYIITNGEKTERNYFELIKSKKSVYEVKVLFENADPLGLVNEALKYIKDANQVWIVFDIDYTYDDGRLIPAIQMAEKNGIKYAFSNLAFEVWLISHFQQCEQPLQPDGHQRILDSYLSSQKGGLIYDKTDREQLKTYFIPKYKTAVENAKIVYQKRMKDHRERYGEYSRPEIWKWNSCTSVFKLIEALKLQK